MNLTDDHYKFSISGLTVIKMLYVGTSDGNYKNYRGSNIPHILYGKWGDDELGGGNSDDIISGGQGDDLMLGSRGDDTYYFNPNEHDEIFDYGRDELISNDTVVLPDGVSPYDLSFRRDINDLWINNTKIRSYFVDALTIAGVTTPVPFRIENLSFDGGTLNLDDYVRGMGLYNFNVIQLDGSAANITGTDARDIIIGTVANDVFNGGLGSDQFYGDAGDDILGSKAGDDFIGFSMVNGFETGNEYTGGIGTDTLNGSRYGDTYYFNAGDGMDTIDETGGLTGETYADKIVLGSGITPADVTLTRGNNTTDLLINFSNGTDQIRISDWYGNDNNRIESLAFADGTVWDVAAIHEAGLEVHGVSDNGTTFEQINGLNNQNDRLYGEGGNDILFGFGGDDQLYGGTGNDVLLGYDGIDNLFGGNGSDFLAGGNGVDTLDGGLGSDKLYGGLGNDILGSKTGDDFTGYGIIDGMVSGNEYTGGSGADTLNGSRYGDTYYFDTGDGMDTIDETGGLSGEAYADQIILGNGITASDVWMTRENTFGNGKTDLLINFDNDSTDQIRIKGWYENNNNRVESVVFTDGSPVIDVTTLSYNGLEVHGDAGIDYMYGLENQDDRIYGEAGGDYLYGFGGNDKLYGGDGADMLIGFNGFDELYGGNGNDDLYGLNGNDVLDGGAGSDKLYGAAGNDILGSKSGADFYGYTVVGDKVLGNEYWGGQGADILNGSLLGDIYYFNSGDGMDTIDETSGLSFEPYADKIVLGADISEADVRLTRENNTTDLLINFANGTDQIRISQWYANDNSRVESLEFADGVAVWDVNTLAYGGLEVHGNNGIDILNGLNDQDDRLYGEDGNDVLFGYGGNDQLYGGNGTDTLVGFAGMDRLYGEDGDDYLNGLEGNDVLDGGAGYDRYFGGAGNDTLGSKDNLDYYGFTTIDGRVVGNDYTGGTGDDTLNGTYFADTYYFNIGDGADTIDEINGSPSEALADNLVMGAGINSLDLIFQQNGNDLDIQRANSQDRVTVTDWYSDVSNQVETVSLNDGAELLNTQVDLMIQAMATFSADNGGISWEQAIADRPDDVQAVIAAYWQPAA